jgi:hypothetical protein
MIAQASDTETRAVAETGVAPDFTYSGDLKVPQVPLSLNPGTQIKSASLQVTGMAFHGLLKDLSGVNVTASPVVYDSNGVPQPAGAGDQAFIVDFTGIRSILKLQLNSLGSITLVLPWNGTEFSSKTAFPHPSGPGPFQPTPDATGSPSVGFAALETVKLLVQIRTSGGPAELSQFTGDCRIETSVFPSNLKASVAGRPPFFTRPGVLNGTVEVTGLEQDLNTLLSSATTQQNVQITIATDTPGVLQTDFDPAHDLELQSSALARFGGQASQNIALDAMVPQDVPLVFPTGSSGKWKLIRLDLDLSGQFPIWRAFSDQAADRPGALGLRINGQFSSARRFAFAQDADLYGFGFLFRPATEAAQLHLQVLEEQNGQPGGGQPIASADFSVPTSQISIWINALFASPVRIAAQKNMWITLNAKAGSVEWSGVASPPDPTTTAMLNSGGGAWHPYPSANGQAAVPLLRILRRPFTQENQPLLGLATNDQTASVELSPSVTTIPIDFGQDGGPVVAPSGGAVSLSVNATALAAGTMIIRRAQMSYKEIGA